MNRNDALLEDWRQRALRLEQEVQKTVIGQETLIRRIAIGVFARGHLLLEGDVGVGKTTLLRAVARAIGGAYERIEGTIDLMPNDLVYYTYISEEGRPRVDPGPLLKHGTDLNLSSVFFQLGRHTEEFENVNFSVTLPCYSAKKKRTIKRQEKGGATRMNRQHEENLQRASAPRRW